MEWTFPPLPYPVTALEPHMSAETLDCHHGQHHAGYLRSLRDAIGGTPLEQCSLDELVAGTDGRVFDLAAQAWNHAFFWRSMRPAGGGSPPRALRHALERSFGSFDAFRERLIAVATGHFGSGWAWLYRDRRDGRLVVAATPNAETPFAVGDLPLLAIDVWEHAYYLDYHHERERYATAVVDHLLDWDFAAGNLATAGAA